MQLEQDRTQVYHRFTLRGWPPASALRNPQRKSSSFQMLPKHPMTSASHRDVKADLKRHRPLRMAMHPRKAPGAVDTASPGTSLGPLDTTSTQRSPLRCQVAVGSYDSQPALRPQVQNATSHIHTYHPMTSCNEWCSVYRMMQGVLNLEQAANKEWKRSGSHKIPAYLYPAYLQMGQSRFLRGSLSNDQSRKPYGL